MKPFLDLTGASGAAYRFRLLPAGEKHVPIAGNYALVRPRADGVRVVAVAATDDLSRAAEELSPQMRRGASIYTRLNVARAIRETEHADLAARYAPADAEPPVAETAD